MRTLEDMAELIGPDNPIVRKELLRLEHGRTSVQDAERLFASLLKRMKDIDFKKSGGFLPPDYDAVGSGEVFFAKDWERKEKSISLKPTFTHISVYGSPDRGKTELLRRLIYEYVSLGIARVMVFDFLGKFSDLASYCRNCVCLDTPSINILATDGVSQQRWINVLFDVIAFHTDTMLGGRAFLSRTKGELDRIFEGTGEKPCLADLSEYMQWLLRKRKLNLSDKGYCERIVGKLISWNAESDEAFSCQTGILEALDSCNVTVSLAGLSEELQRFYVSVVIAREFIRRLFIPTLRWQPLVVVVDECKHVFSRKDERPGIKSRILSILTQTRNVNVYWIVATQEPSQVAHTCLANSSTKIILGMSEGLDLSVIQQSLRLNASQVRHIAQFVEPGQAVIKLSRYPEPFLGRIDLLNPPVEGTQDVAAENVRLAEHGESSVIPRSELLKRTLFSRDEEKDSKYGRIGPSAKRLLEAYGREPHKCLTELYEASGLGTKGSKARKELVLAGFFRDRNISVKTRRGPSKSLLSITEKGRSWLSDAGIRPLITGKGGPRELYYSVAIEEWAVQKGFAVYREYKGADLMLVAGDGDGENEKIAVEIACRKENQVNNISRNLKYGIYSKIVVACEDDRVLKNVEADYRASEIDPKDCKITFLLVTELIL